MSLKNFEDQLQQIKNDHRYETYTPYMSSDRLAKGDSLQDILPKLTILRKEISEYKEDLSRQKRELYEEIKSFLLSKGLREFEYTGKKMTKTTAKYLTAIYDSLHSKFSCDDWRLVSDISNMEKCIKAALERKEKDEREAKRKSDESKFYSIVLETAKKYLTPDEINAAIALNATREQIENLVKDRYEASRIGETISISCCQECDDYEMGERRCSCGNRRISAYAEGYYSNDEYQLYIKTEAY